MDALDFQCDRCQATLLLIADQRIKLAGGFLTKLCLSCRNSWHSFITTQAIWDELIALAARQEFYESLAVAGQPVAQSDWVSMIREFRDLDQRLFAIAQEWVASKSTSQNPEPS